uniref:Putative ovule protein n=1 Tax=Solanum chacoense TaxID=4108 RepID=A0A0V0GT37_SOLCH
MICKLQHKHPYFFSGFSDHISLCLCKLVISIHKLDTFTVYVSMFLFENASANNCLSQRIILARYIFAM